MMPNRSSALRPQWKPGGLIATVLAAAIVVGAWVAVAALGGDAGAAFEGGSLLPASAGWTASPFLLFALIVEPLATARGARWALGVGLLATLILWGIWLVEAGQAVLGDGGNGMAQISVELGLALIVNPLAVFALMTVLGWAIDWKQRRQARSLALAEQADAAPAETPTAPQ